MLYFPAIASPCKISTPGKPPPDITASEMTSIVSGGALNSTQTKPKPADYVAIHKVVASRNLWSRYDRHFVGITRYNVWSQGAKI